MRTAVIAIVVVAIEANLGFAQKMTYEEAKRAIPKQPLPAFWITDLPALSARWAALKHGQSEVIAHSPGGRPLHLITFGTREELPSDANFNSAIGGRQPSAYLDKEKRAKPVIFFVGPVHGQETEGLVGLVNLIHILETGRDLRDRERTTLRSLAERCRLVILPSGNPDGLARFEPRTSRGMTIAELEQAGLPTRKPFTSSPESGNPPPSFNLVSALYHTSGATAFTFESPRGVIDEKACHVDFDQMLEIHLLLFEAVLRHALVER